MSFSLNKIHLIGNLGKDPDIRSTTNGNRVANFTVATNNYWTDANGEKHEQTDWHNCVAWNGRNGNGQKLADVAEQMLRKGTRVYVEGQVRYGSFVGKDGMTRYVTEIQVQRLGVLTPRGANGNGNGTSPAAHESAPLEEPAFAGVASALADATAEDFPAALNDLADTLPF